MLALENDVQMKQSDADEIYLLFYSNSGSAIHSLAVRQYTKAFGLSPLITHCKVAFGRKLYEVTAEGTISTRYQTKEDFAAVLDDPSLTFFWHCFLKTDSREDRERNATIEFMLDRDVASNRKWSPKLCLKYLADYVSNQAWLLEKPAEVDFSLAEGTVKTDEAGFLRFNLPFTCATQAVNVMRLFLGANEEILLNSHVPASVFLLADVCEQNNYGHIYKRGQRP